LLGGIGMTELMVILVIVMMIFGVGKLPEVGRSLGEGVRQLKSSVAESGAEDPARGEIEACRSPSKVR